MEIEQEEAKLGSILRKNAHENDDDVDDEDPPLLSSHALEALKEFLAEQNEAQAETSGNVGDEDSESKSKVVLMKEDWNLSQFWYDKETAETVAEEVLSIVGGDMNRRVACIACPTLYAYLRKISPDVSVTLLEYDKRFGEYGSDFTFYDYNEPEELPSNLKHAYQIIVADPPYLSKECLEKVTKTVSFLSKPGQSYLLLLTGEVQKDRAAELLSSHSCCFRPQHSSKLGNEFRLFTNYDPGKRLGGWDREN